MVFVPNPKRFRADVCASTPPAPQSQCWALTSARHLQYFSPKSGISTTLQNTTLRLGARGRQSILNRLFGEVRNSLAIYLPSPVHPGRAKVHIVCWWTCNAPSPLPALPPTNGLQAVVAAGSGGYHLGGCRVLATHHCLLPTTA